MTRIDTLRRQITATITLLELASAELDTLHDLAYTRPAGGAERVAGGQPDWALDTHGDIQARVALKQLGLHLDSACGTITLGAHAAVRAVKDLQPEGDNTVTRSAITAQEHLDLIDAADRRRARGEYAPHRTNPQPTLRGTEKLLKDRIKRLEKEKRIITKDLTKALNSLTEERDKLLERLAEPSKPS